MKIIENKNKITAILNNGDVLEVLNTNNNEKINIKCLDEKLYVNELLLKTIDEKKQDEQEINKLRELLDKPRNRK